MFHLILTACVAGNSGICAPILLPAGEAAEVADCRAGAERISSAWLAGHQGLEGGGVDCTDAPPALPVDQIAPGVYVHIGPVAQIGAENAGRIANLGFVVGDDAVAVIDAGGNRAEGQELYAAIRAVTDRPVTHLVLTHDHPDHMLGAAVFAEAGARIIGHPRLPDAIAARGPSFLDNLIRIAGPQAMAGTALPHPVEPVPEGGAEIDLGGRVLSLVPVQVAHTQADLTVRDSGADVLFTGDLLFRGLTPVVDGSINGWLDWMAAPPVPEPALIVPGHGPVAASWAEAAAMQETFLTALREAVRSEIAFGTPMSAAVPAVGAAMAPLRGDWVDFDATVARDATAAYKELEWE